MKKIYFVTFEIKRKIETKTFVFHCMADNAQEAKEIAIKEWGEWGNHETRQIKLYAKKSGIQDAKLLKVRGWDGYEHRGAIVIGLFILVDRKKLRVYSKHQY